MSRSSGGRSAVSTIIGTPASSASTTEGWRLAAADPEVQRTAAGIPEARAVLRLVESTATNRRSVEPAGRKGLFVDLDAEARRVVDDQLVALSGDPAADRVREEPLSGEPMRDSGIPAAGVQGLDGMGRGRDPDRALQRAGEIGGHQLPDFEHRPNPADLAHLDGGDIAGAELACPASVEGGDQALVGREPNPHPAAQLDHLLEGPDRLLGQLDPVPFEGTESLRRVPHAP